MPELPEVETTVKGLNKKVLNRTFVGVWTDWAKIVKKPKNFSDFEKKIKGKKIIKAWRRAKNVVIDLSEGYSLLVHQKMTGHLLYGKWSKENNVWKPEGNRFLEDPYNKFLHIMFYLDNGKMLALSDLRKFAKVELWKTEDLFNSNEFRNLGPEPLEKGFNLEKFKDVLRNRKGNIKEVLMKPEIIAGIGNIYSNEALWLARIHPKKKVAELTEQDLEILFKSIQKVLKAGIELGGESFSDYRNIDGEKGNFDDERNVYKREGQKCPRCATPIKRQKVGQRSAFFCPSCQKL